MMILFLDSDGVLHADDVYRNKSGIALKGGGMLFEHAHTDDDLGLGELAAQQRLSLVLASTINQVKD